MCTETPVNIDASCASVTLPLIMASARSLNVFGNDAASPNAFAAKNICCKLLTCAVTPVVTENRLTLRLQLSENAPLNRLTSLVSGLTKKDGVYDNDRLSPSRVLA